MWTADRLHSPKSANPHTLFYGVNAFRAAAFLNDGDGRRESHGPSWQRKKDCVKKPPANPKAQSPKGLEFAVAALLLTGKLKVDSIQMFTDASLVVSLVGKYKTLSNLSQSNVDKLVSFLDDNSSLTLNEIMPP